MLLFPRRLWRRTKLGHAVSKRNQLLSARVIAAVHTFVVRHNGALALPVKRAERRAERASIVAETQELTKEMERR